MYQDLGLVFSDSEETEKAGQYYTEARKLYQELMNLYSKEEEKLEVLVTKLSELGGMPLSVRQQLQTIQPSLLPKR